MLEPPLVLMDEPLSNLDAALRLEMRTEIRRLHQSLGLTTVYVTHDQEEALALADRLVVLRDGEVQQIGSPEERATRIRRTATWPGSWATATCSPVQVTVGRRRARRDGDRRGLRPGRGEPRTGSRAARRSRAVRPEDFTVVPNTAAGENAAENTENA